MKKIGEYLYCAVALGFAVVFLPVLATVIFVGNRMDYNELLKIEVLLDNKVIFVISLIIITFFILIAHCWKGFRELKAEGPVDIILFIVLVLGFAVVYKVNLYVAGEIAFFTGWDPYVVGGYKVAFGGHFYYSIYHNNIPITYFLRKLYEVNLKDTSYPYNTEFIWIQMNCWGLSAAGLSVCLTIKKLTGKVMPTVAAFALFLASACVTPWKIIPYTDMYGIAFPAVCICLYVYSCKVAHRWQRFLLLVLAYAAGCFGGFQKATIYIAVIAVFLLEFVEFCKDIKKEWYMLLGQILVIALFVILLSGYQQRMCREMQFEPNPDIAAGWQHYLLMGLNEENTGSYYEPDYAMFGQFQDEPHQVRNRVELQMAWTRLREKGFFGYLYFLLKKLVMTFNDGTFGWWREGGFYMADYPPIAKNNDLTEFLRNVFWEDRPYTGRFHTYSQGIWLFLLCCLPGMLPGRKRKREEVLPILALLGLIAFQMLFETRARYLLCFLPVFVLAATLGLWKYAEWFEIAVTKKKMKEDKEK